jgi:hypothetical protein
MAAKRCFPAQLRSPLQEVVVAQPPLQSLSKWQLVTGNQLQAVLPARTNYPKYNCSRLLAHLATGCTVNDSIANNKKGTKPKMHVNACREHRRTENSVQYCCHAQLCMSADLHEDETFTTELQLYMHVHAYAALDASAAQYF